MIELMVCTLIMAALIGALSAAWLRFNDAYLRIADTQKDLETASRFLQDVKEDLRGARYVGVLPNLLSLGWSEEGEVTYEFFHEEGTVRRSGDGPSREYPWSFNGVDFSEGRDGTVSIEVELRRHDPRSEFRPRWEALVFCRNRER